MQLEGIDTQQISRIEDPFNPSDLKKKKKKSVTMSIFFEWGQNLSLI